ncbi:MAG: hypothetical protein ONB46_16255 [candidate division KSB1 bacterium]|nr:hypothetical protein [candidate division KSB1 bacterium]MDZ7367290.1 hypothetical protein [candidate division KSB1 bacterium]MDZ7405871.1 hypothetical protein [candidate division KSB1 bacterium]
MTHVKLTGYFSLAATLMATVSGLVLTYQAVFQTKISSGWGWAHIISTFALMAALWPHVLVLVWRNFKVRRQETMQPILAVEKQFGWKTLFTVAALDPAFQAVQKVMGAARPPEQSPGVCLISPPIKSCKWWNENLLQGDLILPRFCIIIKLKPSSDCFPQLTIP